MKIKRSAGILVYRKTGGSTEVLLAHPGGPFWQHKDLGAWSIPKGEVELEEDLLIAAMREFHEETGLNIAGDFITLTPVRQKSGKIIHVFAVEGDPDVSDFASNTCTIEYPYKSGKQLVIPEVDRIAWFDSEQAAERIVQSQLPVLRELFSITGV